MTVTLVAHFFKLPGASLCKVCVSGGEVGGQGGQEGPRNTWTEDSCLTFNLFGEHALEVAILSWLHSRVHVMACV